jgi:predicted AAA+ superfamily ATPase
MTQELIHYLQQQIRTSDERLKRFTHNVDGTAYPKRFMYVKLQQYVNDFLNKKANNRMVIIPGFRGVGKTTLMSQICTEYKNKAEHLFLSIEDSKNLFDVGIAELMTAYEEILGEDLESMKKPLIVFLDEIQADPKWALTLKSLFERTTNIFFCCSGSSAVVLQSTSNLARRAIFEKLPPMCFTEYKMTKDGVFPPKNIKNEIKSALYLSNNATDAHKKLLLLKAKVNQYWTKTNRVDIKKYLAHGSLPFSFIMPNETAIYDSISLLLDKIIKYDLPMIGSFDNNTLNSIKRILFAIAENDTTSFVKLAEKFGSSRITIGSIFDALEKAELLIKIPAYGANMTIANKANKYLFMSPAIRMSFFYSTGLDATYNVRLGKLLEDSIGAHFYREFIINGRGAIRYDSQAGGADFILQIESNKQIIVEVGMGDKGKKQILQTAKKISSDYNIIFSSAPLELDKENNILFVPLDYYFLM